MGTPCDIPSLFGDMSNWEGFIRGKTQLKLELQRLATVCRLWRWFAGIILG